MATCTNCGRTDCRAAGMTGLWQSDLFDCERAAHVRTRAELAAARASSPPSPGLVEAAHNAVNLLAAAAGALSVAGPAIPGLSENCDATARALRAALPKEGT